MSKAIDVVRVARAFFAALLVALPALACGPDFPDRFLIGRRDVARSAPRGDFAREIDAIKRSKSTSAESASELDATVRADLADLASYPGGERVATAYEKARRAAMSKTMGVPLPPALPREIELYARAAEAFHAGNLVAAEQKFRAVLALPASERRTKTTWATYMLGKLLADDDAIAMFRETRALARRGFEDRLGLASTSLADEARVELSRKHYAAAVDLYLAAHAAGDTWGVSSLQIVAAEIVRESPAAQKKALSHGPTLEVVAAYLASRTSDTVTDKSFAAKRRLDAVVAALPDDGTVRGVERLAWFAYRLGDVALAKKLVARAEPGTIIAPWLEAKLAMRAGKKAAAARALGVALAQVPAPLGGDHDVRLFPFEPATRVRGELAVLKLERGDLEGALRLLIDAGSWRDAAHVAERVLTVEELIKFVDHSFPEPASAVKRDGFDTTRELRYLLARRLVRADRASTAMRYMPPELRANLTEWLKLTHASGSGTPHARAQSMASLARMQRHLGMELMGTELAPDWHLDGGSFDEGGGTLARGDLVSTLERERFAASAPAVSKRFHYRYVAAETMRRAADLETGDEAAALLCVAHRWLSARDGKAAGAYTRELSRRKLGRACSSARVDELAAPLQP